MGKIKRLDDGLVALIAAGEVVEGPWSVVKELMENGLDAGARRVEVFVAGGGFDEIRVVDDGCGMDAEDVVLALERHATSKVARAADLDAIATMGFRGEALPAIAAVARVTILTRAGGEGLGLKAVAADGKITVTEEGTRAGTTVTVRDLYYNVPARRKFAGQPLSEWRRAAEVFKRLALARLAPAFSLTKDGRLQYTAAGSADARQRVGEVLGWDLVEKLVPVTAYEGDYSLTAFLSPPGMTFISTASIYTSVNGRPARAKSAFKAVMGAYEGRLERGRYPLAVVYLSCPPGNVDVNVHPRKEEVRFADESAVYEFLSRSFKGVMGGIAVAVPAAAFAAPPPKSETAVSAEIKEAVEGYLRRRELWPPAAEPADGAWVAAPLAARAPAASPGVSRKTEAGVEVLGQLDDTYIIARRGGDLLVVDQHTAHERVIFERLLRAREGVGRQALLLPITVTLAPAPAAELRACLGALDEMGFAVEEFGGASFVVRAHPADLAVGDMAAFLTQVVTDFVEAGRPAAAAARRETLARSVACRAAVKAGGKLGPEEMAALVADLWATTAPEVCPHGRPTMVNLASRELARLFQR